MNDLFQMIKSMAENIECLKDQLTEYEDLSQNGETSHLQDLGKSILQTFSFSQTTVLEISTELNSILTQLRLQANSDGDDSQTPEKIRMNLKQFFKTSIIRSGPIPTYAGCFASRAKSNMKKGSFICAKIQDHFYLYIIESYTNHICLAYDPADINNGIHSVSLKENEWTPMPLILPEKPVKRYEHTNASEVLSLYREKDDDEWTTEFYKAKVIKIPSERQGEDVRGYLLLFEGSEPPLVVPEKFVIQWKES